MLKLVSEYRVFDWIHYLGFALLGMAFQKTCALYLFPFVALLLAYAYSLNNFYDLRKKSKVFLYPLIISLPFFLLLNFIQIFISLLFLFMVTTYSARTFNVKNKKIISTIYNAFSFTLIFFLALFVIEDFSLRILLLSLFFFLLNLVAQFVHEICHFEKDRRQKTLNTTVAYGKKFSMKLSFISLILVIPVSGTLLFFHFVNVLFFVVSTIFSIYFAVKIFTTKIDSKFRKSYKKFGILAGFIFFISTFI